jgi:hypothetical protein
VGLTSEYELVLRWTCARCGREVKRVKPLADCCRECPEDKKLRARALSQAAGGTRAADENFLKSIGVRLTDW